MRNVPWKSGLVFVGASMAVIAFSMTLQLMAPPVIDSSVPGPADAAERAIVAAMRSVVVTAWVTVATYTWLAYVLLGRHKALVNLRAERSSSHVLAIVLVGILAFLVVAPAILFGAYFLVGGVVDSVLRSGLKNPSESIDFSYAWP